MRARSSRFRLPAALLAPLLSLAGCRSGIQWSPDGSRVAFLANRAVHVFETGSKRIRRLSPSSGQAFGPAWSRDGRRLCYFLTRHHQDNALAGVSLVGVDLLRWEQAVLVPEVPGVVAALGGRPGSGVRVTGVPEELIADVAAACWSRDGRFVQYVVNQERSFTVWRVRSTGGEPEEWEAIQERGRAFSWSPRGERLCFIATPALSLLEPGKGAPRRVWAPPAEHTPSMAAIPAWSRDGKRVTLLTESPYADQPSKPPTDHLMARRCTAWSVAIADGAGTRLGEIPGPAMFATVADDGRRATYYPIPPEDRMLLTELTFATGKRRLLLALDPPGGAKRKSEGTTAPDFYIGSARPAVSPDGARMALVATRPGTKGLRLIVMPAAGGRVSSFPIDPGERGRTLSRSISPRLPVAAAVSMQRSIPLVSLSELSETS